MHAFTELDSLIVPLDRPNVDTDAILPKQYLKSIARTGFGPFLFDDMRYVTPGDLTIDPASREKDPNFPLNQQRYQGAQILLTRENFGCGSSREHAVWALVDHGIRAVIAPSFADIFYGNSFKSGVLPITLPKAVVGQLFRSVAAEEGYRARIDLAAQHIVLPDARVLPFEIGAQQKHNLLNGLDDIAVTLQEEPAIRRYEAARRQTEPWLFR